MSIIIFLIVLGVLVVSHEFGHFLVAKLCGMKVEEFGFGFPPRLWGKKIGDTLYSINWIPFGGFVRIFGEDAAGGGSLEVAEPLAEKEAGSFAAAPKWQQFAVVFAGVVFNFILAWGLVSLGYLIGLPTSVADATPGQPVQDAHLIITDIAPDSPAARVGVAAGDEIVSLSDTGGSLATFSPESVRNFVQAAGKQQLTLGYKRHSDEVRTVSVTPAEGLVPDRVAIGVAMDSIGVVRLGFFGAIFEGLKTTWTMTLATVAALVGLVKGLFVGHAPSGVTGPVGIVGLVGSASAMGFAYLLTLVAVISVNLSVMNLIPFPALDGGRILFIAIETIRGKEVPPRTAATVNAIGFFVLLLLMAILTYGDIAKLVRG